MLSAFFLGVLFAGVIGLAITAILAESSDNPVSSDNQPTIIIHNHDKD